MSSSYPCPQPGHSALPSAPHRGISPGVKVLPLGGVGGWRAHPCPAYESVHTQNNRLSGTDLPSSSPTLHFLYIPFVYRQQLALPVLFSVLALYSGQKTKPH